MVLAEIQVFNEWLCLRSTTVIGIDIKVCLNLKVFTVEHPAIIINKTETQRRVQRPPN